MITISPGNPTSGDNIELTFSGGGCVNSTSQSQVGAEFQFTIDFSTLCFSPAPAYSFSWPLGQIPEGDYTAAQYVSIDGSAPVLDSSEPFSVSTGVLPFAEAIPTAPHLALVLLSVVLVMTAYRRLKGRA